MQKAWSPEKLKMMKKLADQGLSSTKIAAQMSEMFNETITRNAIIGKSHRLNATIKGTIMLKGGKGGGQPSQVRRRTPPAPRVPNKTVREALIELTRATRLDKAVEAACGGPVPKPAPDFYGVALPPDYGECHFISGDPKAHTAVYCRHPALKLGPESFAAYCPHHCKMMYRPSHNVASYVSLAASWEDQ